MLSFLGSRLKHPVPTPLEEASFSELHRYSRYLQRILRARMGKVRGDDETLSRLREAHARNRSDLGAHPLRADLIRLIARTEDLLATVPPSRR